MIFEWDDNKAKVNKKKHGISFEMAKEVFKDPFLIVQFDRVVDNEERWHAIGDMGGQRIILVVHTSSASGDTETIRMISARKASKQERLIYGNC